MSKTITVEHLYNEMAKKFRMDLPSKSLGSLSAANRDMLIAEFFKANQMPLQPLKADLFIQPVVINRHDGLYVCVQYLANPVTFHWMLHSPMLMSTHKSATFNRARLVTVPEKSQFLYPATNMSPRDYQAAKLEIDLFVESLNQNITEHGIRLTNMLNDAASTAIQNAKDKLEVAAKTASEAGFGFRNEA